MKTLLALCCVAVGFVSFGTTSANAETYYHHRHHHHRHHHYHHHYHHHHHYNG